MVELKTITRLRNVIAAIAGAFAAGTAAAQVANSAAWLSITFGLLAGAGAATAVVLVWLERTAESYDDIASRQREIDARLASAAETLGGVHARVAAIYRLERLAEDAPQSQGIIVQILATFVHASTRIRDEHGHSDLPPHDRGAWYEPTEDVQAALIVLGRRNLAQDDKRTQIRLSDVNLRGASLRGGHFEGARLRRAHLEHAKLEGACLQGAKLRAARLQRADLEPDNELGLPGANLEGAKMQGAQLQGAKLRGAHLAQVDLRGAKYSIDTRWPDGFDPLAAGAVLVDAE